jgi:hypothetical protein
MKERAHGIGQQFHQLQQYEALNFTLLYTNDHDEVDCH